MSTDRLTLCGDCHGPLHPESTAPKTPAGGDPDCYCPHCRRSPVNTVTCHRCGSLVCGACGSIVERATDLGFG